MNKTSKKKILPELERNSERAWYFVKTYSGRENTVRDALKKKITAQGLENVIFDVIVPMCEESEFKNGKRRVVKKKIFPGYVLVDMIVDANSWFIVRNTTNVTGFVGVDKNPIPLSKEEAERILNDLIDRRVGDDIQGFKVNDNVRIVEGTFENRIGIVKSIDDTKQRLKVLVGNMSVDLDVSQVEKI